MVCGPTGFPVRPWNACRVEKARKPDPAKEAFPSGGYVPAASAHACAGTPPLSEPNPGPLKVASLAAYSSEIGVPSAKSQMDERSSKVSEWPFVAGRRTCAWQSCSHTQADNIAATRNLLQEGRRGLLQDADPLDESPGLRTLGMLWCSGSARLLRITPRQCNFGVELYASKAVPWYLGSFSARLQHVRVFCVPARARSTRAHTYTTAHTGDVQG